MTGAVFLLMAAAAVLFGALSAWIRGRFAGCTLTVGAPYFNNFFRADDSHRRGAFAGRPALS